MEQVGPPIHRYAAQLLTPSFHLNGSLEVVGGPLDFLNDSRRDALVLTDVHLTPLTPGSPMRSMTRPQLVLRRQEVALLCFADPDVRADIRLLVRAESLIIYTPLAVLRGSMHVPAEVAMNDVLSSTPGDFLAVTDAHLFPLRELPAPWPTQSGLVIVGRPYVQLYHTP